MQHLVLIAIALCLLTAIAGIVLPITSAREPRPRATTDGNAGTDRQDPAELELGVADALRRPRPSRW